MPNLHLLLLLSFQSTPPATVLWSYASPAPGDRLGAAVTFLGDVDADGAPDVLVGAPGATSLGFATGSVTVLSGRTGHVLYQVDGDSAFDAFGSSLAALDDVDGDGVSDFAIGAPGGSPAGGAVHAFSGATGAPLWTRAGESPGDRFGSSLAGSSLRAGASALWCGAPNADFAGPSAGRAYRLSGSDGTIQWTVDGTAAFDLLGSSIAELDANRVLIGIPFADAAVFNGGGAQIVASSDGTPVDAVWGNVTGDQFGQWLQRLGDVDADSIPDFAVSAPGADANGFDSGAIHVHSGLDASLLLSIPGSAPGLFSGPVAGAGDHNGDGRADLAFGEPSASRGGDQNGRVRLLSGRDGSGLAIAFGKQANDWFGAALCGGTDLDADGRPDVVAGAPGHDDYPNQIGYVVALTSPSGTTTEASGR